MRRNGFVSVGDGIDLAYRDHGGDGRTVLLLHGIGGNLETMDQFAERLGNGVHAVAIDMRGCGRSSDASELSFDAMSRDIQVVAEQLALGPLDVIGHSQGGMVGARYTTTHPEARFVSIDGFAPGHLTIADEEGRSAHLGWLHGARAQLEAMTSEPSRGDAGWRDAEEESLRHALAAMGYGAPNLDAVAAGHFAELGDGTHVRHPSRGIVTTAFANLLPDALVDYRHGHCPTLVIRCTGWAPPPIDDDLDHVVATTSRPLELVRMDCTHLAPGWERLDDTIALIEQFWTRHPVTRSETMPAGM